MKPKLSRKAKRLASALLTTMVICSILSMFVMYYLSLIDQQNFLSARSQTWNMAIAISEAGVEDGLQHLNDAYPNLGTDGWAYDGSAGYSISNSLPDGNSYMAYISITNALNPVVVARAYVTPPTLAQNGSGNMFAAAGLNPGQSTVTRAVLVTCAKQNPFQGALIARKNIDLNGQNVLTDSFDSSDPTKSTNGQYDPTKYRGDKGDVATNLGIIDSLNVGNADIYGHAHTGPDSPNNAVQFGPHGYIGSHADQPLVGSGIDPGWWLKDANFTFPDTSFPNTAGYLTPTGGVVTVVSVVVDNYSSNTVVYPIPVPAGLNTNTTSTTTSGYPAVGTYVPPVTTNYNGSSGTIKNYTWNQISGYSWNVSISTTNYSTNSYNQILWGSTSGTNNYVANSLSGQTLVLGPNAALALPNGLNMSGNDTITLAKGNNIVGATFQPASLIVYSGGNSCTVGGNGFVNQSGSAGNLLLFCAPTVTSFALNGNGTFIGVLVAPSVDVSLNGGGSGDTDFVGCLMANSVTLNGHFNFHYDEALLGNKSFGRFLITSWNEVK